MAGEDENRSRSKSPTLKVPQLSAIEEEKWQQSVKAATKGASREVSQA